MEKSLQITIVLAVALAALSVGFYFVIFLPNVRAQQLAATSQANCLQTEQTLLTQIQREAKQGPLPGGDSYEPIKAHYNQTLKKCYVEVDDFFMQNGSFMGNDYAIYNASEDAEIADCDITNWSPTSYRTATTTTQCENDAASAVATSTAISAAQFQLLEKQYMGQ